jgi:hypothetical protein
MMSSRAYFRAPLVPVRAQGGCEFTIKPAANEKFYGETQDWLVSGTTLRGRR